MLLKHLQSAAEEIEQTTMTQHADLRIQALKLARRLVATLEQPEEVVMRWGFEVESCFFRKSTLFSAN